MAEVIGRLGAPLGFIPGTAEESAWHDIIARVQASKADEALALLTADPDDTDRSMGL